MRGFVQYLKDNYDNQTIGVVDHRASQLALEVITKNIREAANKNDWRKIDGWQPRWEYIVK